MGVVGWTRYNIWWRINLVNAPSVLMRGLLSLTNRQWVPRTQVQEHHRSLARELGMGDHFASLLASRNLESEADVQAFMQPRLNQLTDPITMLGMPEAVERLILALEQDEPIAVFGDYDVDGATSSALVARYFRSLGKKVRVYIPDRLTEGYGPNPTAMLQLAQEGITLVVTVDCGITAFEALEEAKSAGMDVIVTDHHQPSPQGLPPAVAVINPNRLDELFPHKELAGVGVAFYLVMALNRALRQRGWFATNRPEPDLKELLDLVAIGTVADVAPLIGVNRALVSAGLRVASQTTNAGLRAIFRNAGLLKDNDPMILNLAPGQIGYQVGPRINAGGRVDRGDLGYQLLACDDLSRAEAIAALLERSNVERREIEQQIQEEVMALIERKGLVENRLGLVVAGLKWHPGVIGIVASRIAERFHRPAIVISIDEHGIGTGSGRSIPGIDLLAAIHASGKHLITYGGHKAAAGLKVDLAQVDAFAESFDQALRAANDPSKFHPVLVVDGSLSVSLATKVLFERIQRLQPFGIGNPEPVFILKGVRIGSPQSLKDRHVRCQLIDAAGCGLDAIAFRSLPGPLGVGMLDRQRPVTMDVAGQLSLNRFQRTERMQWIIQDIRPCAL